jgi:hydroxymethylglutaryl-CoA lyase
LNLEKFDSRVLSPGALWQGFHVAEVNAPYFRLPIMPISNRNIKLIECPRDAMQGWKTFIPTEKKIQYLNSLLQVGFDTIDFGSFVSPKAIPQMQDTHEVLKKLDLAGITTKLLAIIANVRGAEAALQYNAIQYLGFPLSLSETFQQRNTNASIKDALLRVREIQTLCTAGGKILVVYLSMAFGNPYGDPYNSETAYKYGAELAAEGISIISLADTVGVATPQQVSELTEFMIKALPQTEIGVHLHSTAHNWREKVAAAFTAGCLRFDGALKGIGGCPMADDALVGNMNTEWLLDYFAEQHMAPPINAKALEKSIALADQIFA